MRRKLIIALLMGISNAVAAQETPALITVCFKNPEQLNQETLRFAESALRRIEKRLSAVIRTARVDCPASRALIVTFVPNPSPSHPADVLGATRMAGGTVLPETQVFFRAAAAMLRNPSDENQGTALGNIIAHELYHYLKQTAHHDGSALNCEFLSERQLLATR